MSPRTIPIDDRLYDYLLSVSLEETDEMRGLREETQRLPAGGMQIAPEQGRFMQLLVRLIGAKRTLEIGTFTGYSTLAVALALPPDGKVVACDVSKEWTAIGRRYWEAAGVADKIELHLGPAVQTLAAMIKAHEAGSFDFAFIDADKPNYDHYYDAALVLLRPGGLIAVDNVLWHGAVADPARHDADTEAIRDLNRKIHEDERVDAALVPIGDGLFLARKR